MQNTKKYLLLIIILLLTLTLTGCNFGKKENNKKQEQNVENEQKNDYRMTGNDLQRFDLFFLKLENKEENKVYSPLSIKYALEMLAEGANGETKEQLDAVIGDYVARKYTNSKYN